MSPLLDALIPDWVVWLVLWTVAMLVRVAWVWLDRRRILAARRDRLAAAAADDIEWDQVRLQLAGLGDRCDTIANAHPPRRGTGT